MDLIYLLDSDDNDEGADFSSAESASSDYVPNFTMSDRPGQSRPFDTKTSPFHAYRAGATVSLISLPIGLLIAAASAKPLLAQMLSGSGKSATSNLDDAEKEELDAFLRRHGITAREAKRRGYSFSPGHPKVGQAYRLHPLSKFPGSGKGGLYIPEEGYDELLLDEREAELIRLLVELGATRISITEKQEQQSSSAASASTQASMKGVGGASAEGGTNSKSTSLDHESREFKLVGKPWHKGGKLNGSDFAWVKFEPSWGAMVVAREVGECTKAAIEIREETTFSSEKHISVAAKTKLYGAGVSGRKASTGQAGKVYYIEAEFAPFLPVPTAS